MKKNAIVPTLHFVDKDNHKLLQCKLTSVPLQEEAVLRLSLEFYGDLEPCMIHRSAVMSRMYMEMLEYFLPGLNSDKFVFSFEELPKRLDSFIDVIGCYYIIVKRTNN